MSSIDSVKLSMNYVTANARPACRNCMHSAELPGQAWRCNKGGFLTTVQAVCAQHQRKPAAGETR